MPARAFPRLPLLAQQGARERFGEGQLPDTFTPAQQQCMGQSPHARKQGVEVRRMPRISHI
jgi:hypothetical protein